ncbi:MAG: hypothetical protein JNL57_13815 [Bacteroidetes bacterium]|nr:hypothetical protein [Bacteroidota bacterium]
MDANKSHVTLVLSLAAALTLLLTGLNWKTSKGKLKEAAGNAMAASELPQQPVDRIAFLNEVFKEVKPPESIGRILTAPKGKMPQDSLQVALKWASEASLQPLVVLLQSELAEQTGTESNLTEAARNLVFSGTEYLDQPVLAAFLFQQGKRLVDMGLAKNPRNIPLRNALIAYQSEYLNAPMVFLSSLRETLAMDSNNVETHFIHLNLLKKSGQWKKALQKCQKLISLQPQNPVWLYQASDMYGYLGDSTNAKIFLNLGMKAEKATKTQK